MTTIHLVRHGETEWHAENRYAGTSDVALTDHGRSQADALAAWAGTTRPSRVLSSDLTRAVETALPAAYRAGVPLEIDARLREVHFGRGEGLTAAEMDRGFSAERAAFLAAPATRPLPEGESGVDAVRRAAPVLVELTASASPVLVVAHTTLVRLLLCHLLGLELDDYRRVFPSVANGTVTTVALPDAIGSADGLRGRGALLRFNAPLA